MPRGAGGISQSWLPLAISAAVLGVAYLLWRVLLVFILAGFLAFLLFPIVRLFNRRMRLISAIISVYLLLIIALTIVVGLIEPALSLQFRQFVEQSPDYIERARVLVSEAQGHYVHVPERWKGLADTALSELQQTAIRWARQVIPAVISLFRGLFGLVFVPLLAFFFMLGSCGYKQMLIAVTPKEHKQTVENLLFCMGRSLWDFIRGQSILMAVVGTAVGLGLYMVGFPYPALFGIVAGILEVVPSFGPLFTTTLVALVGVLIDPALGLKGSAVTVAVQILENLLLVPIVMSKTVGLNPVTVAFSVFTGGAAAGVLGAVIAIPIAVMLKIVVLYFYVEDRDLPGRQRACDAAPTVGGPRRPRRRRAVAR